jgi:peptidoglycan/LPS O-acetylase OafA/YrhL
MLPRVDTLTALYDKNRPNSIGFLRYLLAALVVFSHSFRLGGFGPEPLNALSGETLGTFSVDCFFVLSGFLIARSCSTSPTLARFMWHRVLRIFPAFWVCLVVTAFWIGPTLRWATTRDYTFSSYLRLEPSALDYVTSNCLLRIRQIGIADLLRGIPMPVHVNGALWSLEHEFRCYVLVGILGALGLWSSRRASGRVVVIVLFAAIFAAVNTPDVLRHLALDYNNTLTLRLSLWFVAGMLFYAFAEHVQVRGWIFLVALACTIVGLVTKHQQIVGPLALAYVLFYLALRLPFSWWDRRGDFSYGLYIYAFPVQQSLAALGLRRHGLALYFAASMVFATVLAVLSWYVVEKRALRLRHLRVGRAK